MTSHLILASTGALRKGRAKSARVEVLGRSMLLVVGGLKRRVWCVVWWLLVSWSSKAGTDASLYTPFCLPGWEMDCPECRG